MLTNSDVVVGFERLKFELASNNTVLILVYVDVIAVPESTPHVILVPPPPPPPPEQQQSNPFWPF